MKNWKGKRVLILGLGQYPQGSGIAAALYAVKQGADVRVTDLKTKDQLGKNVERLEKYPNVTFRLGEHRLEDVAWADLVIRNQRVRAHSPELELARRQGIEIESAESLFLKRCPAPVVGITGTRGKSTTTTLVANMLEASGKKVWLGGNILISPLTFVDKVRPSDIVVLELSSFQLETTGAAGISPHVACITNLMRDHLNAYENMEEYGEAKAQILRYQTQNDIVVLNDEDAFCQELAQEAAGSVQRFSLKKRKKSSAWVEGGRLVLRTPKGESTLIEVSQLQVRGDHQLRNILAAALTARAAGATIAGIRTALRTFPGLPHRQELVAVHNGITYINDTTATTPDGARAAIRVFAKPKNILHLILGGADKELDFDSLAKELSSVRCDIVILPGSAEQKIVQALQQQKVAFERVDDLEDAVQRMTARAKNGETIVLSPACASFGQFANEFERGERFRAIVKKLQVKKT